MSNQVHLYASNLSTPQEVVDDEYNEGNQQEVLLGVQGNVPALLWIAMFKNTEWQKVVDKEQFEEDEEADIEDYTLYMPIQTTQQAIDNLLEAESNFSAYFKENGGVKSIVKDLVQILQSSKMKYVLFNSMCGDFQYSDENDKQLINDVLKIASGDMSINKDYIARRFSLNLIEKKLFSSKPIIFEQFSENLYESSKIKELLNLYFLIGDVGELL